jgi:glycerophosphoryl diester phosphodiesterase
LNLQGIHYDGQEFDVIDVLYQQVGIRGLFTDWSSTVSYYASCFGIEYYHGSKKCT